MKARWVGMHMIHMVNSLQSIFETDMFSWSVDQVVKSATVPKKLQSAYYLQAALCLALCLWDSAQRPDDHSNADFVREIITYICISSFMISAFTLT